MNYEDRPRTLFGEAKNRFKVVFDGTFNSKKDQLNGRMHRPRKARMAVGCRFTRETGLPWTVREKDG